MILTNSLKISIKTAQAVTSDQKCIILYLSQQIKGKLYKSQSIAIKNINFRMLPLKINIKSKYSIMIITTIMDLNKIQYVNYAFNINNISILI